MQTDCVHASPREHDLCAFELVCQVVLKQMDKANDEESKQIRSHYWDSLTKDGYAVTALEFAEKHNDNETFKNVHRLRICASSVCVWMYLTSFRHMYCGYPKSQVFSN